MANVTETLKQSLLNEHVPNEQVQNIIKSIDMSQINLQNLGATKDYLTSILTNFGIEEGIIGIVNNNIAENFGDFGIDGMEDLNIDSEGFLDKIIDFVKGIFGG